ncbi:MAG TPA: MFS transporter, partial [Myxococcota bacterium]|nr:MFS transporter [Myxococcota bacterium]
LGTLGWWLREVGVDLKTIGLFALVGLPDSFKFLWAPVMDHAPVPVLTRLLGRRRGWVAILLLALLYKFGDAVSGQMTSPFYYDMQFSKLEVASVTKVWSIVATMAGITAGGALVAAVGTFRALLLGGVLQALTNLLFTALALIGHSVPMLAVAVGADSFTGGLAGAAFVAYLSSLTNVRFTGTQYALLTSLMAGGRTVLSAGSGWLAQQLGWAAFFAATAALAIPGLLLLLWLMRLGDPDEDLPLSPAREAS